MRKTKTRNESNVKWAKEKDNCTIKQRHILKEHVTAGPILLFIIIASKVEHVRL